MKTIHRREFIKKTANTAGEIITAPALINNLITNSPIHEGVNWDMFLGPSPFRPFNESRYIYTWHWFWDTGTTEFGNNGIYKMDTIRWALNKNTHPVKVHCTGGKFARDVDTELPQTLCCS